MSVHRWIMSVVVLMLLVGIGSLSAQDSVTTIKDLYEAAAYEDALAALDRLPSETSARPNVPRRTELRTYRALCLLALARTEAAVQVIEDLIVAVRL
jgi:hypothetical protein